MPVDYRKFLEGCPLIEDANAAFERYMQLFMARTSRRLFSEPAPAEREAREENARTYDKAVRFALSVQPELQEEVLRLKQQESTGQQGRLWPWLDVQLKAFKNVEKVCKGPAS
jgi:hypothetical protein